MSIFYSTVARNPLVPELLPDASRLTAAELAAYAATGRALHAAKIAVKRRDFNTWQSAEPASWNRAIPTDLDAAAVGLDATLGLAFFVYVIPDAVGLRDLAPASDQALATNYLTDGSDRWVVLAHGLDVDEDLLTVGQADPILTSFEIAIGDVVCAPTAGCALVGTGSYTRWLSRKTDVQNWEILTSCPTPAALISSWDPSEALLDYFDVTPDGAQLKAKHDRIGYIRLKREDLPADWENALLNLAPEIGGPLVLVTPFAVFVFVELARALVGARYGCRLVDLPVEFRRPGGDPPSLTVARAMGERVRMDPVPGMPGAYLLGGVGRPVRLMDRGVDANGVDLAGWPPAPLPTPIS